MYGNPTNDLLIVKVSEILDEYKMIIFNNRFITYSIKRPNSFDKIFP